VLVWPTLKSFFKFNEQDHSSYIITKHHESRGFKRWLWYSHHHLFTWRTTLSSWCVYFL